MLLSNKANPLPAEVQKDSPLIAIFKSKDITKLKQTIIYAFLLITLRNLSYNAKQQLRHFNKITNGANCAPLNELSLCAYSSYLLTCVAATPILL